MTDRDDLNRGGARIGDDTPLPPSGKITTPAGPEFVKNNGSSGARPDDHTHARISHPRPPGGLVPFQHGEKPVHAGSPPMHPVAGARGPPGGTRTTSPSLFPRESCQLVKNVCYLALVHLSDARRSCAVDKILWINLHAGETAGRACGNHETAIEQRQGGCYRERL